MRIALEWARAHRREAYDDPEEHGRIGRSAFTDMRSIGAVAFEVDEYSPGELAVALELHPLAAQRLMADAVDVHDRLPNPWAAVQDLQVEDWVARKIAALTHDLGDQEARWVDEQIGGHLGSLPTGRLLAVVEGKVTAADPVLANARADDARRKRGVWLSRAVDGARSLVGRCDAADATECSRPVTVWLTSLPRPTETPTARTPRPSTSCARPRWGCSATRRRRWTCSPAATHGAARRWSTHTSPLTTSSTPTRPR